MHILEVAGITYLILMAAVVLTLQGKVSVPPAWQQIALVSPGVVSLFAGYFLGRGRRGK